MKISIGIPAFNEEKNIAAIITKLQEITESIIVCNDGSSDLTGRIAERMGVMVINHKKNLGYGAAIRTIFLKAKEIQSDILITFDADGQHRIEDVERVLNPIVNNQADIIIGSRFLKTESDIPQYRKFGIKMITKITNSSIKQQLTDSQSGLRAYNKRVITEITPSDSGMGISTEILIKADQKKMKIAEVSIKILYSGDTSTHNPISHGTSVLISTIKYTSIEHPLKFYGIPSVLFLAVGFFFTYASIQFYSEVGRLNTNLTLLGAGTILIGIVLLITAILLYSLVSVVREKS